MTQVTITNDGGTLYCDALDWNENQICSVPIRDIPLSTNGSFVDTGTHVLKARNLRFKIRMSDNDKTTLNAIFNANALVTIIAVNSINNKKWTYNGWFQRKPMVYEYKVSSTAKEWVADLEFKCQGFALCPSGEQMSNYDFEDGVRTIVIFNEENYVECVPSDVGKVVYGVAEKIGLLLDYNNTTRTWYISDATTIGSDVVLQILGGTGEGWTSTSNIEGFDGWSHDGCKLTKAEGEDGIGTTIIMSEEDYIDCVPNDVGKIVSDDESIIGVLISYNNTTRTWYISNTNAVESGSEMTIDDGTGYGLSSTCSLNNVVQWDDGSDGYIEQTLSTPIRAVCVTEFSFWVYMHACWGENIVVTVTYTDATTTTIGIPYVQHQEGVLDLTSYLDVIKIIEKIRIDVPATEGGAYWTRIDKVKLIC